MYILITSLIITNHSVAHVRVLNNFRGAARGARGAVEGSNNDNSNDNSNAFNITNSNTNNTTNSNHTNTDTNNNNDNDNNDMTNSSSSSTTTTTTNSDNNNHFDEPRGALEGDRRAPPARGVRVRGGFKCYYDNDIYYDIRYYNILLYCNLF